MAAACLSFPFQAVFVNYAQFFAKLQNTSPGIFDTELAFCTKEISHVCNVAPFIPSRYTVLTGVAAPSTKERRESMSVKITGLDKLEKQLKQMEKAARELEKTKSVSFGELFTSAFMRKHTPFSSIDELLQSGGFNATSQKDFENIPDNELDKHIAKVTKFKNWDDFVGEAADQYALRKLGF